MSYPELERLNITDEQMARLAVLYNARAALLVELDSFDFISACHWIAYGCHMPMVDIADAGKPDAARWTPGRGE